MLDYNDDFKSAGQVGLALCADQFRVSDHDPVIVGLNLNAPPTVDAGGPYTVAEGGSVTLTASATDEDGDQLTYAWDLDNDGAFDDATGASVAFSAAAIDGPATRTVRVQVGDGEYTAVDTATVDVTNVAPTATFNAPASVFAGFPIALSLTNATDAAPADRPGLTYAFDCGSGYGAFSASSTASCPTDAVGTRSVGGKVRDDDGGVTEYRATVSVRVTYDEPLRAYEGVLQQAGHRRGDVRDAPRGRAGGRTWRRAGQAADAEGIRAAGPRPVRQGVHHERGGDPDRARGQAVNAA